MFKGKKGQKLVKDLGKKSFVPGAPVNLAGTGAAAVEVPKTAMPRQDIDAIKVYINNNLPSSQSGSSLGILQRAIASATTLEEVERLNQILQSGHIPGQEALNGLSFSTYY